MNDHTTPMVLAQVFRLLASDPSPQHKRWARVSTDAKMIYGILSFCAELADDMVRK